MHTCTHTQKHTHTHTPHTHTLTHTHLHTHTHTLTHTHTHTQDHYENPRNVGSLTKDADDVGTGLVGAPACGDVMKLQIKVEDGVIVESKFKTFGCGSAIASSSCLLYTSPSPRD